MFGKREFDSSPRRFWSWFTAEAEGISNALEALSRGEADAEWAIEAINNRIKRVNPTLEADIVRTLDGQCCLTITGADGAVDPVLACAPRLRGWQFLPPVSGSALPRIPFLRAPRPSLDVLAAPITGRYEAYA